MAQPSNQMAVSLGQPGLQFDDLVRRAPSLSTVWLRAAFVLLLGYNLRRATAGTKVLNFTSNIASLLIFAAAGDVVWQVGLPMGVAQAAGAWTGSHLVIRHGSRLIRPLLVVVSLAISLRLLLED